MAPLHGDEIETDGGFQRPSHLSGLRKCCVRLAGVLRAEIAEMTKEGPQCDSGSAQIVSTRALAPGVVVDSGLPATLMRFSQRSVPSNRGRNARRPCTAR